MSDDEAIETAKKKALASFRRPGDSPPQSVEVEVSFGGRSRQGPLRSANDDHYLILRFNRHYEALMTTLPAGEIPAPVDEYGYAMVVADGMGGSGEAASRIAVSTLAQLAINFGNRHV